MRSRSKESQRKRIGREPVIFSTLTQRERQIAQLVCEGWSNNEIGRQLNLSGGTVKVHLRNIYRKLAILNRAALATLSGSARIDE